MALNASRSILPSLRSISPSVLGVLILSFRGRACVAVPSWRKIQMRYQRRNGAKTVSDCWDAMALFSSQRRALPSDGSGKGSL